MNEMCRLRVGLVFALLLCLSLTGCTDWIEGETDPKIDSSDVDLRLTSIQDGNYSTNGTVRFQFASEQNVTFERVRLCAYTESGSLLSAKEVGNFTSPHTVTRFSLNLDRQPGYVFVDHPRFREFDVVPEIFDWTHDRPRLEGGYPEEYIDQFEYRPPTEPGTCGTVSGR